MNISDLNHISEVAENTIIGGSRYSRRPRKEPRAEAFAVADATALGKYTDTYAITAVNAVAGVGSSAYSESYASAKGKVY